LSLNGPIVAAYNILLLVTIISLITRRLGLPSTVTFIFAGVISPIFSLFPLPNFSPEIFVSILLPPIIFHETLRLDVNGVIDDSKCIMTYAFAGTLLTVLGTTIFLKVFLGLGLFEAALLSIIISPTDPVSVINTFNNLGVVKRFRQIISGESLLNDGVAISLYSIIVTIITLGSITPHQAVMIIFNTILGGVLLGIVFGYAAHILFCWTDDKFAGVLISFLVAFGVSWISESVGASSIIATVIAGLIINYRMHKFGGLGRESIDMLKALWEFVGFTVSSIAFIFIGMNLDMPVLLTHYPIIICVFVLIVVTRYLMVYGLAEVIERLGGKKVPKSWRFSLSWLGLRGAVSAVLALGVSSLALPNSELIIVLTFGVVLISNIVQGLSVSSIIRRFEIVGMDEGEEADSRWMRDGYTPLGFERESSKAVKLLFAAPEYFVFDTRLGGWLAFKLEAVQSYINGYLEKNLPTTSGGTLRSALEISASLSSKLSNRIIQARSNYYLSGIHRDEGDASSNPEFIHWFSRQEVQKRAHSAAGKD
jgi:CPA1 family monovalent cation:H+ antiporter